MKNGVREFHLECTCGAEYDVRPTAGDYEFSCKKCGRELLVIRRAHIKGVEVPRFIEAI